MGLLRRLNEIFLRHLKVPDTENDPKTSRYHKANGGWGGWVEETGRQGWSKVGIMHREGQVHTV